MADVVLQRITITRELLDDGQESYSVEYEDHLTDSDTLGWLDGLGLLEAAKFDLYELHQDQDHQVRLRNS